MSTLPIDPQRARVLLQAKQSIAEFRVEFGREPSRSYVAELYAAQVLGLRINSNPFEAGCDATDDFGKKYEIKLRSARNVDLNSLDCDYIVLVNMSYDLNVTGMWLMPAERAREIFVWRSSFRKFQTTQVRFKRNAERIALPEQVGEHPQPINTAMVTSDREIMGGAACFTGTRVPIRNLFDFLEGGDSIDRFLANYPRVTREQATAVLEFASFALADAISPEPRVAA
jgi:uncharacterized protein (DUF433 family)